MKTAVIIVAAGSGLRAGGELPKQYQNIGGKPVLARTVAAFQEHPAVGLIQVVIGPGHDTLYQQALGNFDLPGPVTGGATRQASVRAGLEAVASYNPDYVLIHDAARPFVAHDTISHVVAYLDRHDGVIPGLPVADTLKLAHGCIINKTVDRSGLWVAQTPQGFHFAAIRKAHQKAAQDDSATFTDDASIAEWAGLEVAIIPGTVENRKLTTTDDIHQAQRQLAMEKHGFLGDIRVGNGFDVHAFEPGDSIILCGVNIPHSAKLKGHSDADVAMHALTDAIFGALSDGDIGAHYPPSDEQWKGADSSVFLKGAGSLVTKRGGVISHCDVTIICEEPKLRPHIDTMRARLAEILGITLQRVAVKATTSEQLGFAGRREGIAAMATATLRLPLEDV
jgi:2-C-methyl-D-erythritol 4-phosphate cytidylyltransferase/2-C-methyl-D-erythritol 2,4-cyclodiphosphate synthase